MCFQKFSVWAENKGKMFMFGIDVWIYFFYFNMFFSLRCQINFLKPRFNIEFDLVIFQVLLLHPQPGWAFLECCHSAGQDGWCFFISECHISGRFNVFVWLRSQKEAKRFHYQQTWNRSFLLNPHFTELMRLIPTSAINRWRTCRAVAAVIAHTAQDTHPLQSVCTIPPSCWARWVSYTTAELPSHSSPTHPIFTTNLNSEYSHLLELDSARQEEQQRSNKM